MIWGWTSHLGKEEKGCYLCPPSSPRHSHPASPRQHMHIFILALGAAPSPRPGGGPLRPLPSLLTAPASLGGTGPWGPPHSPSPRQDTRRPDLPRFLKDKRCVRSQQPGPVLACPSQARHPTSPFPAPAPGVPSPANTCFEAQKARGTVRERPTARSLPASIHTSWDNAGDQAGPGEPPSGTDASCSTG